MKPLSKLHQEAILKAKTEGDQNKAAALAMIETPIEMIKAIMLKHELAVIEVMRELHEAKEAAVRAEREAIAQSLDKQADLAADDIDRQWAMEMAAAVISCLISHGLRCSVEFGASLSATKRLIGRDMKGSTLPVMARS